MPLNLLVFPLLGGYIFLINFNPTRFHFQRLDRQRLIFHSAIFGVISLVLSIVIVRALNAFWPELSGIIYAYLRFHIPFLLTSFGSFLLPVVLSFVLNWFFKKEKGLKKAIEATGTQLELLIKTAIDNKDLVCFSLKSGKVYIGYPSILTVPNRSRYIVMFPILSGYRDDAHLIKLNTHYLRAYDKYIKDEKEVEDLTGFRVVLPIEEIISARRWYLKLFKNFKESKIGDPQPPIS